MKKTLLVAIILMLPSIAHPSEISVGMQYQSDIQVLPIAVGILGTSLIASHLAAPETYSWRKNTISELGAQHYKNAWIMRSGFIGFGSLISGAALLDLTAGRHHWSQTIPMIIYGTSVALTGVYSAAPLESDIPCSEEEARIHSLFANIAGYALTTALIGSAITERNPSIRLAHVAGIGFVVASSAMFKLNPENKGLWQRMLWTGSLTWMTVSF